MDNFEARPRTAVVDPGSWLARACVCSALALAVYGLVANWAGGADMWQSISNVGSGPIVAGLAATLLSLVLRGARWHVILGSLGDRLPWAFGFRVYLGGLSLSSTPGKIGETARSLLLHRRGVAYAHSIAAFVCERLADVIGIALVGALAAWLSDRRQPWLEVFAGVCLVGSLAVAALQRRHFDWPRRARAPWIAVAAKPIAAWAQLWRSDRVGTYVAVAAVAYGIQGIVFASFVDLVHPGLGTAACLAVFVNATLIGAASMVPGGLGTMDSALVLQLQSAGVPTGAALAASIATRACTLWFAWLLGLGALFTFSRSVE